MAILISMLDYRCIPLFKLSKKLENNGVSCFYLVDDSWVYEWLLENTTDHSKILKLAVKSIDKVETKTFKIPEKTRLKITEFILRDRYINSKKLEYSQKINLLFSWYWEVLNFVKKNNIRHLLIEGTPLYELISELVFKNLKLQIIVPDNYWKEPNKSLIYASSDWSKIYRNQFSIRNPNEILNDNLSKRTIYNHKRINKFNSLRHFLFRKKSKINSPNSIEALRNKLFSTLRPKIYKFDDIPQGVNYDLYFYHVEPEKSTLNCGFQFKSQTELIWHIRFKTEASRILIVKEHPDNRGRLKVSNLKEIQKIPGVIFISAKHSTINLISNAHNIYTISGTVAIECAALGKSCITFGNKYFNLLQGIIKTKYLPIEKTQRKNYIIQDLLFPFEFSDSLSLPSVLREKNLQEFTNSILAIINNQNEVVEI